MKTQKTRINFDVDVQRKWKVIYSYPDSLRKKFEGLKEGLYIYIDEGPSTALFEKYHFNQRFWKSFYYQISKSQSLELSFRKAKGLQSYIGFEWCKYKIKSFYQKYRKIPPYSRIPLFHAIKYACSKGFFTEYFVSNWKELWNEALPGIKIRSLKELEGLERVKNILIGYYSTEGRIPPHTSFRLINHAIKRKIWVDHNIESWTDLLFYTFGKRMIPGYSNGLMGLNKAQEDLILFFEKNGFLPRYNDFTSIYGYICRGDWLKFDIYTWNDMMKRIFGRVNHSRYPNKKEDLQFVEEKLIKLKESDGD
jgi:hypothetical protein